jgi:hypothetical protein
MSAALAWRRMQTVGRNGRGVSRRVVRALGTVLAAAVVMTLSPMSASATVAVVGVSAPVAGTIDYTTGTPATGIPAQTAGGCFSGPASLNAAMSAAVTVGVNSNGLVAAYVGLVSVAGSLNEGPCSTMVEEVAAASGLTVSGTSPTGSTLSCGPFSGFFDRLGPVAILGATAASCNINGLVTGPLGLILTAVWAPTGSPTLGATAPVARASIAGTLVLEGAN